MKLALTPRREQSWKTAAKARIPIEASARNDMLASSAIAAGNGFIPTTLFKRRYNIDTSLSASSDGAYLRLSYLW